jgi:hypothetical protein
VKNSPVASGQDTTDPYAAWCRCGTPLADGEHRLCTGESALLHSARVEARAELLLSRMRAIQLMGTMNGGLRPLYSAR